MKYLIENQPRNASAGTDVCAFVPLNTNVQPLEELIPGQFRLNTAADGTPAAIGWSRYHRTTLEHLQNRPVADGEQEVFTAWMGCMAVVALHRVLGLPLGLEKLTLDSPSLHMSKLIHADLRQDSGGFFPDAADGATPTYYHLTLRGIPFALLRKDKLCLYPFRTIALPSSGRDPFEAVPWFDLEKRWWKPITPDGDTLPEELRGVLAAWVAGIDNDVNSNNRSFFVHAARSLMGKEPVKELSCTQKALDLGPGAAPLPAGVLTGFTQVPAPSIDIPADTEVFTDFLTLVCAGTLGAMGDSGDTIYARCRMGDEDCIAMLPWQQSFVDFLQAHPGKAEVRQVRCDADGSQVTVSIQLLLDGAFQITKKKTYPRQSIYFVRKLPYPVLWPAVRFIGLPQGKSPTYYVASVPWRDSANAPDCARSQSLSAAAWKEENGTDRIIVEGRALPTQVETRSGWGGFEVQEFSEFPDYLGFSVLRSGGARQHLGFIPTSPCRTIDLRGSAGTGVTSVGIDYGTSNTVFTYCDDSTVTPKPLEVKSYAKAQLTQKSVGGRSIGEDNEHMAEFRKWYWHWYEPTGGGEEETGPYAVLPGKMRSLVQEYICHGHTGTFPYNGRMLPADQRVIDGIVVQENDLGGTGRRRSMSEMGVHPSPKLVQRGHPDERYIAMFLDDLLQSIALEVACRGGRNVEFWFSAPDRERVQEMRGLWNSLVARVRAMGIFSSVKEARVCLEATAAAAYVKEHEIRISGPGAIGGIDPDVGYMIVDIGGGTSDASLSLGEGGVDCARAECSLRYAGNAITSASLYTYAKLIADTCPDPNTALQKFSALWQSRNAADIRIAWERFQPLLNGDGDGRTQAAQRMQEFHALTNGLMADLGLSSQLDGDDLWDRDIRDVTAAGLTNLTSLVRLKVTAVMFVIAGFLKNTGAFRCRAAGSSIYPIYLAGGGSNAASLCGADFLGRWLPRMLKTVVLGEQADSDEYRNFSFVIRQTDRSGVKQEVAEGMLTLARLSALPTEDTFAPEGESGNRTGEGDFLISVGARCREDSFRRQVEGAYDRLMELIRGGEDPAQLSSCRRAGHACSQFAYGDSTLWLKLARSLDRNLPENTPEAAARRVRSMAAANRDHFDNAYRSLMSNGEFTDLMLSGEMSAILPDLTAVFLMEQMTLELR